MKRARATREDGRGFDAREAMRAWTRGARETTREATLRAFHGGDVTKILRECRDGSNEAYDDDDVEAAMEALTRDGTTINAPFCFTAGAIGLKRALHLEAWARLRGGEFRGAR